jgi:penicillin-binding protein 1A
MARAMGIRTPVSTNPAISLGGLKQGVSVLDMAHAYETFAHGGQRVEGTLGAPDGGPVGIDEITGSNDKKIAENRTRLLRVLSPQLDATEVPIMGTVVSTGTGTHAQIPGVFIAGKTGTTENYGDAWFVAFNDKYTVAVWVGYPNGTKSMKTDYGGAPVEGGTFPAEIWRAFMVQAIQIDARHLAAEQARHGLPPTTTSTLALPAPSPSSTSTAPSTATTTPSTGGTGGTTSHTPTTQSAPAPTAPSGGGGSTTTPAGTGGASPTPGGASPPPATP